MKKNALRYIPANTVIKVLHLVPEGFDALAEKLDEIHYKTKKDLYLCGEATSCVFFHIRKAVEYIPHRPIVVEPAAEDIMHWPRLRKALQIAGVTPVHVPGGEYPLYYEGQAVVLNYRIEGTHYFVIERKDIGKYLDTLPLDEGGKKKKEAFTFKED